MKDSPHVRPLEGSVTFGTEWESLFTNRWESVPYETDRQIRWEREKRAS